MLALTPGKRQSKTLIQSTNVDHKSLETKISIVICRPNGDKWQSKTLFLVIIVDPRSSIAKSVFDCHIPGGVSWRLRNMSLLSLFYIKKHTE